MGIIRKFLNWALAHENVLKIQPKIIQFEEEILFF